MITKKKKRNYLLIIVTASIFIAAAINTTSGHWWKKAYGSTLISSIAQPSQYMLYRGGNGDYLLYLDEPTAQGIITTQYIIQPKLGKVGIPISNFLRVPGFAYSQKRYPLISYMDSIKIEVDPNLIVLPNKIEFTTALHSRVQILG